MGAPIDVLRTSSHLHMLLYALNKLFYVYKQVGVNDVDGQCVVAYKVGHSSVTLLHGVVWHPKEGL